MDRTRTDMMTRGGTLGAVMTGAIIGAGAAMIASRDYRQKASQLVDTTMQKINRLTTTAAQKARDTVTKTVEIASDVAPSKPSRRKSN